MIISETLHTSTIIQTGKNDDIQKKDMEEQN